jgi:uncharacterized protein involved in exopolysaccharide biosynthesis
MTTFNDMSRTTTTAPGTEVSGADIGRFFRLRARLMIFVVVSTTVLVAGLVYVTPGTYSSTGIVLVERGKSPTFRVDPVRYELEAPEVMNSEIGILTSRTVTEKVIDQLALDTKQQKDSALRRLRERVRRTMVQIGLSEEQSERSRLIKRLTKKLKVKEIPYSSLLAITFGADDPSYATVVARTYMDVYIERHREIYSDSSATFFKGRYTQAERELERVRESMARETDRSQIQGLTLQKEALETTYRFYRERWDRATADAAGELSLVNIRAVDYPSLPAKRDHSRFFAIMIAFAASLVFSLAVSLVWHFFDHTVYDPRDVTSHVNVPVLGSIRRSRDAGQAHR